MPEALRFPGGPKAPPAPEHLSHEMRRWWGQVTEDFILDPHHLQLLRRACEAWDIAEVAREAIEAEGQTFKDRFGQPKPHPAVSTWQNQVTLFTRLVRELQLDAAPDVPRSPRLY